MQFQFLLLVEQLLLQETDISITFLQVQGLLSYQMVLAILIILSLVVVEQVEVLEEVVVVPVV